MSNKLRIYEIDYSVSPGGTNEFEVYSTSESNILDTPLFSTESLHEAIDFCYGCGVDFEVRTLAQYYTEEHNENELLIKH